MASSEAKRRRTTTAAKAAGIPAETADESDVSGARVMMPAESPETETAAKAAASGEQATSSASKMAAKAATSGEQATSAASKTAAKAAMGPAKAKADAVVQPEAGDGAPSYSSTAPAGKAAAEVVAATDTDPMQAAAEAAASRKVCLAAADVIRKHSLGHFPIEPQDLGEACAQLGAPHRVGGGLFPVALQAWVVPPARSPRSPVGGQVHQ